MDWFIINTNRCGRNRDKLWSGREWTTVDKAKVYPDMKSADDVARELGTAKSTRAEFERRKASR